ncbi:Transcriptional regulator LytR [Streptomyces sp. RB5]|uniref:Transcriptional regulator LytR n=1 Tax=Streptomyces smaragdinus TaxID=2585196 RepID=A0A7K0CTL9_9ACTN|nr:LCP family protein [Streptomyces smaragdinus]MQY16074.1 Transcriptional regulator LytR [Streptomyces smaragdinus]
MVTPTRRPGPRWGLRIAALLSLALLAAGGGGHLLLARVGDGIGRVDAFHGLTERPDDGKGLNFLVVGTDRRDGISDTQRARYRLGGASCNCTDTIMLVHVSGDRDRASVVSIPRDSYVEFPPHTNRAFGEENTSHAGKINSAYAHGGPPLTVRAVEKMTGVHIDHYLEIDFTGFMKTVDMIGGVDICSARPLHDDYSGLDLPAGTTRLGGGQALQYVRARHVDGTSDLSRMRRQQQFLSAVLHKIADSHTLLNPVRLRQVSGTVLGSVRADSGFSGDAMFALGRAMRDFSPRSSEFTTVPIGTLDHEVPGVGATILWDKEKADALFARIRADEPLRVKHKPGHAIPVEIPPNSIRVQVTNGAGEQGLGSRVDTRLANNGFATTGTARNAPTPATRTTITYDPNWTRSAHSLKSAIPSATLVPTPGHGPTLTLTLSPDFDPTTIRRVRPADPILDGAEIWSGFAARTGDAVECA